MLKAVRERSVVVHIDVDTHRSAYEVVLHNVEHEI